MKAGILALALAVLVVEGFFLYRWYERYYGYDVASDTAAGEVTAPEERTGSSANQETVESTGPEDTQDAGDTNSDGNADAPAAPTTVTEVTAPQTQPASQATTVQEQESEAEYVSTIGEIQAGSVEAFLESAEKLRQPDSLTAADIEEMEDSLVALSNYADQIEDLKPPENYTDQHDLFAAAVDDLHGAAEIAYRLATDPASATRSDYDTYDLIVDRAATGLQRSNEILDEDYETIEQAQGDGR